MFKKYLAGWIFLWFILVLGCVFALYTSTTSSQRAYQQLMNNGQQLHKDDSQNEIGPAKQKREQVSKQIFYQKDFHRLQIRLTSDSSDLIYSKKEGKFVECFNSLVCTLQEKMLHVENSEGQEQASSNLAKNNQQLIRQFKAKEALYSYKTGELEAKNVEIAHFLLPGLQWPQSFDQLSPLIQGKAHSIKLSLFKEASLKAQGFQAIFHQWERD